MAYQRKYYELKIDRYYYSRIFFVYLILDPDTKEIKYVGRTQEFKSRVKLHLSLKNPKSPIQHYISKLLNDGKKPIFQIIELASCKDSYWLEAFWIGQLRAWGFEILNVQIPDNKRTFFYDDVYYSDTIKMLA